MPVSWLQLTGVPSTAVMLSPGCSTPAAGRPFSVCVTVFRVVNRIPSVHRAAAWAVCCELAISAVSCWTTCCSDWLGGNSSDSGTTAVCGVSQARIAVNTLKPSPGPPRKETVTRLRCPEVGYVRCPSIVIRDRPEVVPRVFSVGPGDRIT